MCHLPFELPALNNKGLIFLNGDKRNQAAELFEEALQIDPRNQLIQNNYRLATQSDP
jgi:hypothetical protein